MDGTRGVLGVTSTRSLDFLSLGFFMFGQDRIPTKWIQIVLEKFVHFQEATFHLCEAWLEKDSFLLRCWAVGASWGRWDVQTMYGASPMLYKSACKGCVQSDALRCLRVWGGICISTGLTSLGRIEPDQSIRDWKKSIFLLIFRQTQSSIDFVYLRFKFNRSSFLTIPFSMNLLNAFLFIF